MLIGITATVIIALGIGISVVLLAAAALTRRSVELDPALEEVPIEQWANSKSGFQSGTQTQLHLS
jgi:ABC-type nickel/cobalt efflux system permease component RcnA